MTHTHEGVASAASTLGGWAEVHAADHSTRYMRFGMGTGTPIVILLPARSEANIWPELFESLSSERRIYIPDLPDSETCFAPRMRGFLDGLGLSRVTLIAPGSFCVPALEFALLDPDRLEGLVLVPHGAAEMTGLTGGLSTPTKTIPVLVVRRDASVADAMELVGEFVAGG